MEDFKPCGNFKARLVVDGHLTKEPTKIVHSGVVSLRNFRLTTFTAEPSNFQLCRADDENAYLQALTKERLCIVAGPVAEELHEHVLVMNKALDGTRPGGACWHGKAFDILQLMKFLQPPLFWKDSTSELTAKTKGSDRIFTIKMSLSQPLMVQGGTPIRLPKEILGFA